MSRPHSVGKDLVANTKTTMFTVPTRNIAKWLLLFATNHSASSKWFTCWWYDKSENTEIEVLFEYSLTAKTFIRIDGTAYVTLDEGDEIRVQSETGSATTCIITVELEQRSTVQQFN
jgi:hypothetical protein